MADSTKQFVRPGSKQGLGLEKVSPEGRMEVDSTRATLGDRSRHVEGYFTAHATGAEGTCPVYVLCVWRRSAVPLSE